MIPLAGFLPDVEPTTPGAVTDCINFIPTEKGMAGGPTPGTAVAGLPALAAACRGAAILTDTMGVRRNFAGTQTRLYELSGSAWIDRSRAGNYTGSADNRWSFAQFGNIALAANYTEPIQFSSTGAFADVATAPKARILVAAKDFVIAFATNDAGFGDQSDRWWCSAFQDYSSWTPSVSTQATTGRLVGVPGGFTAAASLGAYVVAYKERGMYLGQYAGAPVVWQWDQVPGEVGCVGPEAVVDIGGAHIFVGPDNIWQYDGTRAAPIATGQVRQWFYDDSSATYRFRTMLNYDRNNSRIWIFYPSASSSDGTCDRALVYHLVSKKWGRANRTVQACLTFIAPGLTWDTLGSVSSTWDGLPAIPWDSQTYQAAGRSLGIFDAGNNLRTMTGQSDSCSFTTGDFGDDWSSSLMSGSRVRFIRTPSASTATGYSRAVEGAALDTRSTVTYADGKYDFLQDARWHRISYSFTGDVEIVGHDPKLKPTGRR